MKPSLSAFPNQAADRSPRVGLSCTASLLFYTSLVEPLQVLHLAARSGRRCAAVPSSPRLRPQRFLHVARWSLFRFSTSLRARAAAARRFLPALACGRSAFHTSLGGASLGSPPRCALAVALRGGFPPALACGRSASLTSLGGASFRFSTSLRARAAAARRFLPALACGRSASSCRSVESLQGSPPRCALGPPLRGGSFQPSSLSNCSGRP